VRAASPSRSVSGPGMSMDSRQSAANAFCSRPGRSSGEFLQSQNGYPGMKDSGKTMSREPSAATSSMSRIAFATVASRSRKTGVACTAAAVYRLGVPVMVTPFTIAIVNRSHNAAIRNPGVVQAACCGDRPPSALSRVHASRAQRCSDSGRDRAVRCETMRLLPAPETPLPESRATARRAIRLITPGRTIPQFGTG
jgi:hypothetical protein